MNLKPAGARASICPPPPAETRLNAARAVEIFALVDSPKSDLVWPCALPSVRPTASRLKSHNYLPFTSIVCPEMLTSQPNVPGFWEEWPTARLIGPASA
jgi:hypothetical protein